MLTECAGLHWLGHSTAFGLAVYASPPGLPHSTQDSLPAAGQALLDGLEPAGLLRKVSECFLHLILLPRALLGAITSTGASSGYQEPRPIAGESELGGFVHNVATIGTPGTGWDWLALKGVRGNPHGPNGVPAKQWETMISLRRGAAEKGSRQGAEAPWREPCGALRLGLGAVQGPAPPSMADGALGQGLPQLGHARFRYPCVAQVQRPQLPEPGQFRQTSVRNARATDPHGPQLDVPR
jgi:hypothetical protein